VELNFSTILYASLALYLILGLVEMTILFLIGATLYGNGRERTRVSTCPGARKQTEPQKENERRP